MTVTLGFGVLVLAFVVALYASGAALYGALRRQPAWVESARLASILTFPLATFSTGCLVLLLVNARYDVEYVFSVISESMPLYLRVTALWGGQAGSLLFWSWLMSLFASAVMLRKWTRDAEFLPWVVLTCMLTLAFFLGLTLFIENPFARIWSLPDGSQAAAVLQPSGAALFAPAEGSGLNPMLRHPGMVWHPPALYLGFVGFVIPFAFAVASLVTGRVDDRWVRITRRWTLAAWLFLSLGLIIGMRWAYDVLGWGGYWGWDPVEVAALMPWLSGTTFLHSAMIQEKRGMMKRWNAILIILTYDLVIFGTFLTRSGVLSSVHAFAQSAIGPLFFVFIGVTLAVSLGLVLYRWNDLKAQGEMTSLFSRESAFLFNNLVFMGILLVCFWGVLYPLISEALTGQKVTVGPPWFESATGPLWALLLLLMGVAPLTAWRASTARSLSRSIWKPSAASLLAPIAALILGVSSLPALLAFWLAAFALFTTLYDYGRAAWRRHQSAHEALPAALWALAARNRRRYGGYIIHLGVVFMALGIIGIEMFQTETQGQLRRGESLSLAGYTLRFDGLDEFDLPEGVGITRATLSLERRGQALPELHPRREIYFESGQPVTIPGIYTTMESDLYVVLVDWQPITAEAATFKVYHNPLVNWMWLGGLVFILGTLVAALPSKKDERADALL